MQKIFWRVCSKVLSSWRRLARLEKARREESKEILERVQLAQSTKKAEDFDRLRILGRSFVRWSMMTENHHRDSDKDATNTDLFEQNDENDYLRENPRPQCNNVDENNEIAEGEV